MACGSNCPCCKKKAKKRVTKKKVAVPRAPPHRMVNINVVPPVGEGAPRWKKDLVSVDTIGGKSINELIKSKPIKNSLLQTIETQTEKPIMVDTGTEPRGVGRPRYETGVTITKGGVEIRREKEPLKGQTSLEDYFRRG